MIPMTLNCDTNVAKSGDMSPLLATLQKEVTHMEYPNIDIIKTGLCLKRHIKQAGYTVKQIQEYLHLSCPQPVYRWFKGQTLPSIDHLYALSKLLRMSMDELIVAQNQALVLYYDAIVNESSDQRLVLYYHRIQKAA